MNTPQDHGADRLEQNAVSRGGIGGNPGQPVSGSQGQAKGDSGPGHETGDTARELKETIGNLASEAGAEGKARVDDYREVAAAGVGRIAQSVKAAASELEADDVGSMSRHIADLAGGMERLSKGLREKSGDELLRDVHGIARNNPGLFLAASVAVGFGLTRLLRASAVGIATGSEGGSPGGDSSTDRATSAIDPSPPAASSHVEGGFAGGTGAATRGETISGGRVQAHSGHGSNGSPDARAEGASGTYGAAGTLGAHSGASIDTAAAGGIARPGATAAVDDGTGFATGDESNGRKPL